MKKQICCGMEVNAEQANSTHDGYCSCYGEEAESYLEMVHSAEGHPAHIKGKDCSSQCATNDERDECCTVKRNM